MDKKALFIGFILGCLIGGIFFGVAVMSVDMKIIKQYSELSDSILQRAYFYSGANEKLLELQGNATMPEISKMPINKRYLKSYVVGYNAVAIKFNSTEWDD